MAEGETGGRPCVVVYVAEALAAVSARVPAELDGRPVVVRESGEFQGLGG